MYQIKNTRLTFRQNCPRKVMNTKKRNQICDKSKEPVTVHEIKQLITISRRQIALFTTISIVTSIRTTAPAQIVIINSNKTDHSTILRDFLHKKPKQWPMSNSLASIYLQEKPLPQNINIIPIMVNIGRELSKFPRIYQSDMQYGSANDDFNLCLKNFYDQSRKAGVSSVLLGEVFSITLKGEA